MILLLERKRTARRLPNYTVESEGLGGETIHRNFALPSPSSSSLKSYVIRRKVECSIILLSAQIVVYIRILLFSCQMPRTVYIRRVAHSRFRTISEIQGSHLIN